MNKDEIAGKMKEVGGKARKNIGKLTGDSESETRGAADQMTGNVQKNYGKVKDALD
jgi:uncharacterized protein YjbJ (UPF0337 family)